MKKLSRQRLWQLKHKALGLCRSCSRPVTPPSTQFCQQHNEGISYKDLTYLTKSIQVHKPTSTQTG